MPEPDVPYENEGYRPKVIFPTGLIDMGSREVPIDVTLDAPLLGTDAALEVVLCQLPLEPGYTTAVRTFDPRSQKVRVFSFEVTG